MKFQDLQRMLLMIKLRKLLESLLQNGIQIKILKIRKKQHKNLKRFLKLMIFQVIRKKDRIMINMDLKDLILDQISILEEQMIFLSIFLVTSDLITMMTKIFSGQDLDLKDLEVKRKVALDSEDLAMMISSKISEIMVVFRHLVLLALVMLEAYQKALPQQQKQQMVKRQQQQKLRLQNQMEQNKQLKLPIKEEKSRKKSIYFKLAKKKTIKIIQNDDYLLLFMIQSCLFQQIFLSFIEIILQFTVLLFFQNLKNIL